MNEKTPNNLEIVPDNNDLEKESELSTEDFSVEGDILLDRDPSDVIIPKISVLEPLNDAEGVHGVELEVLDDKNEGPIDAVSQVIREVDENKPPADNSEVAHELVKKIIDLKTETNKE